jgi:hypothetical protein
MLFFHGNADQTPKNPTAAAPEYTVGPRMMFALRERLEEEGLGQTPQARNLERAFLTNREYILEELQPLFSQLDKNRISRSPNPRYWWWRIDDEAIVREMTTKLYG